jgi:hypothetical protein
MQKALGCEIGTQGMMSDGEKKPEDKNLMRLSLQTEIKYSHNY